ncbi:MAG: hydroxyacid dehydrogenase [Melioribacteraceae bacterium]|nr:hydroxyacid dehydrogenase [Melioribacteraceae bacterium]
MTLKIIDYQPHGIIVRSGKVTREAITYCKNLKIISKHGVGVDNIDVKAATEMGIPVTNTPKANFESVAELTVGFIYALARSIPLEDKRVKNGIWDKKKYPGVHISGKTLGLIGFGRIGVRVAELVNSLNLNIIIYDPFLKIENLPDATTLSSNIDELLSLSDFVSLHCPLTTENKHLINKEKLALMKPTAFLINTARGGLIDETELAKALEDGKLSGAAIDAFEQEPPNPDNPLFKLDNVIASTHVGGASDKSFINMGTGAVANLLKGLASEKPDRDCWINPI